MVSVKGSEHEKSSSHRDGNDGCGSSDAVRLQEADAAGTDEGPGEDRAAGTEDHAAGSADHASACPCAHDAGTSADDASARTGTSACTNEVAVA